MHVAESKGKSQDGGLHIQWRSLRLENALQLKDVDLCDN